MREPAWNVVYGWYRATRFLTVSFTWFFTPYFTALFTVFVFPQLFVISRNPRPALLNTDP